MKTTVKAVRLKMHIYPTQLQDCPAGESELNLIRSFVSEIEKVASMMLPNGRYSLSIKEERDGR